jgi:hypothetical protein
VLLRQVITDKEKAKFEKMAAEDKERYAKVCGRLGGAAGRLVPSSCRGRLRRVPCLRVAGGDCTRRRTSHQSDRPPGSLPCSVTAAPPAPPQLQAMATYKKEEAADDTPNDDEEMDEEDEDDD